MEVLIAAGLSAKLRTLRDWGTGRRSPRGLSTSALERFLNEDRRGNHSRCRPLKSFRVVFGSVIPGVTAVTRAFQVSSLHQDVSKPVSEVPMANSPGRNRRIAPQFSPPTLLRRSNSFQLGLGENVFIKIWLSRRQAFAEVIGGCLFIPR